MIDVDIILEEGVNLPKYETKGAAGFDLAASSKVSFLGGDTKLVPTGIKMKIPEGYELQIRPRSGLSLKTPFRITNSPGTIDSDYRGEIKIIIQNTGVRPEVIQKGDRIAQGVLVPVNQANFIIKHELDETERGAKGFGSTG